MLQLVSRSLTAYRIAGCPSDRWVSTGGPQEFRRGPPDGARVAGPGPGAYRLPTTVGFNMHDPSRYRNPMFSFGINAGFRLKPLGPGPAYRIDRVTREGNMTAPAWSFGSR